MPDGSYTYQGVLTGKELEFVVEVGINQLMMTGALPFLPDTSDKMNDLVMPANKTEQ